MILTTRAFGTRTLSKKGDLNYIHQANRNSYVKKLRAALDSAGFTKMKLVVPDGSGKCLDCPQGRQDIVSALLDDKVTQTLQHVGLSS